MGFEKVMEDLARPLRSSQTGDHHHGRVLAIGSGVKDYNDVDRFSVDVRRGVAEARV